MNKFDFKEIRLSTINECKSLPGLERTELIEEVLNDYYSTIDLQSPVSIQRHYRELFTKLVKNFGH
jgi:hypothetical protein|tara:strand:+ start:369 stop:566 length:198 start_codon:yes stop_codon:yes gene_type:complete